MEILGKLGRDKVTGFEGIIFGKVIHLFGCTRYELKPKVREGKLKKTESFDEHSVEVIGEGITVEESKREKLGGKSLDIPLGKLGRDKVTGFEGIIAAKGIHLFGSDTYALVPKVVNSEVKFPQWFDAGRIEIIDAGITAEEVKGEKPGSENLSVSDNLIL